MGAKIEAVEPMPWPGGPAEPRAFADVEPAPWYILRAATRQEKQACKSLEESRLRVVTYLPLETVDRILGGAPAFVERPWLPGYLFASIDDRDFHAAIEVFGVHGPVMTYNSAGERVPRIVHPSLVASIQALQIAGAFDRRRVVQPLERGDIVRIIEGPFEGRIGEMLKVKSGERVRILLAGFGPTTLEARMVEHAA